METLESGNWEEWEEVENNITMYLSRICCEDDRCTEFAEDSIQWQLLVLAIFNFR
jgi:hypothetical protein